jgi:hypothetical protein
MRLTWLYARPTALCFGRTGGWDSENVAASSFERFNVCEWIGKNLANKLVTLSWRPVQANGDTPVCILSRQAKRDKVSCNLCLVRNTSILQLKIILCIYSVSEVSKGKEDYILSVSEKDMKH